MPKLRLLAALLLCSTFHCFAQGSGNQCQQSGSIGIQPAGGSGAIAAGYLASIIPTPGLTPSPVCGTSAVRCASDSSLTATAGSGEGLNQFRFRRPQAAANPMAANPEGTGVQIEFFQVPGALPSVSSFPLGQSVGGYMNLFCNNTGTTPSSSSVSSPVTGKALAGSSFGAYPILGSKDLVLTLLADGSQVVAWLDGELLALRTAIRSADGSKFTLGPQYAPGSSAQFLSTGDFNGDGISDLALTNYGNGNNSGGYIQIFLGQSDGTFKPIANATAANPTSLHAADFNGDGKLDLAVANLDGKSVQVLLGNGDGTFGAPVNYSLPNLPVSLIAADLNGDGKADIAVATISTVSVLLGNGDGTMKTAVNYSAGKGTPAYIAAADMNGDGAFDLVVATPDANAVSLLLGNGNGTFQTPVQFLSGADDGDFGLALASDGAVIASTDLVAQTFGATPISAKGIPSSPLLYAMPGRAYGIAAADLNGDQLPDMVAADGAISVLVRDPAGAFKAPVTYAMQSGSQPAAVAIGDLNGDGKNDVVAASASIASNGSVGGVVDVVLGNGDGTLGKQNSYPLGGYPGGSLGPSASGVALGDFNGDGKLDVAAGFQTSPGSPNSGGVSILLGNGDGTLRAGAVYGGGAASVFSMIVADFNHDGKLDIAAGTGTDYFHGGALVLLMGKGDGTFQSPVTLQVGSPAGVPSAIAGGDINGDGKPDLVVAALSLTGQASLVVLLGNGDGTFSQLPPARTGTAGSAIAILDLNGDGVPDVVVGDCCGLSESVYMLGNGDGTFQTPHYFASGTSVTSFAATSWNNDGIAGLAVANQIGTVLGLESGLNPKIAGGGGGSGATAQVTSAAGQVTALAPGSLASAFGSDLATGQPSAPALPWPLFIGGTSVTITDPAARARPPR